jgi:dipeptidyl aminopeptidase/acylaminoacyl peptidase
MVKGSGRMARKSAIRSGAALGLSGCFLLGALLTASPGAAGPVTARPQPRAPTLAELVEAADLSSLAASPDGRLAAFRTDRASLDRNSYDLRWSILDLGTGTVSMIGGGEPIVADPGYLVAEAPLWSPDGRWIYYRALHGGAVQIWRAAADGSAVEIVTHEDGDIVSIELARGGRAIAYRVGPAREAIERAELDEYENGIFVDQHVELGQNLFRGAIINGRPASERLTGRWFSRGGVLWAQPPRGRRLDFASLATSDIGPEAFDGPLAASESSPDTRARSAAGDVAAAVWNDEDGSLTVTRPAGAAIACEAAECRRERIAWVAWRLGHDQILFATADRAHVQTLRLWDIGAGRVRTLVRSQGLLNGGRRGSDPCAVARDVSICVAAGPESPPRLVIVDLGSGRVRPAFDPNDILRGRQWPGAERLSWHSRDGRLFTGILFAPARPGSAAAPLFINYYRCEGFVRGGVGDEWPFVSLAAAGIVSVCVNATRATGPYDAVEQYRAAQGGIEALVDLLAGRGLIDRGRVGIGGLSFGSEVAMWTLIRSDLIAAASLASPQFEPANYWFNGVRGRDHHDVLRRAWGLGAPDETPERWRLLSPALNIDRIRAPLLLQLPEQESRYAVELYARLSNSPTPTEMYVFPDERHIKMQPRHRLAAYRRNLDWFRFWLQGQVDPDPAKAEQFRRWQELAERRDRR